jgi:hypothetical protein
VFRELTDAEKADLYDMGRCPFCGCEEFFEGPHGGLSVNWCCANDRCLACFNLTPPALRSGQLIRESYLSFDSEKPQLKAPRMPEATLRELFKRRTTLRQWFDMLKSSRWGG